LTDRSLRFRELYFEQPLGSLAGGRDTDGVADLVRFHRGKKFVITRHSHPVNMGNDISQNHLASAASARTDHAGIVCRKPSLKANDRHPLYAVAT